MKALRLPSLPCWCGTATLALAAVLAPVPAVAQSSSSFAALTAAAHEVRTEQVQARLLAHAPEGIQGGKPLWLGLQLTHAPHWHTYWKNPGDSGQATSLRWTLPAGLQAGEIGWPLPSKLPVGPLANYGYDGTVLLPVAVKVPAALPASGTLRIALEANWLVCKQECIPQQGRFTLDVPVGQPLVADAAAFEAAQQAAPRPLPGGDTAVHASVDAQHKRITFSSDGLPAAWQGKPHNLYPETPEIITPAAAGEQRWDGKRWQMELPLHEMRMESPARLPVVLALRGTVDADGVVRNAAGPAYRSEAAVEGTWPAAQSAAEISPELAAALRANAQASASKAPAAARTGMTFWLALGGALLGGLLLNLMPCVFPVLAIKVMSFARHAHSPREQRVSGLAYTAGVVLSFAALAGLLLVLRAAGEQLGWGFQLQNPWLVAALAGLFTVLGLNLAGVFHVGQVLPGALAQATARHPVSDALLSGVLAVLVASPCTAPFMGASLGYAIQLPALQALLLFMAMGVGLALPILLGSFFPGVLRWLPRPGAWMDTFKQLMAFPMFATVVWLLWVLGHQSGIDGAIALLTLLLTGSALLWALGRTGKLRLVLAGLFGALLLWLGMGYGGLIAAAPAAEGSFAAEGAQGGALWQPWSEQRVQQALAAGQPVFVDYTAAWCVTCQFNKKTVMSTEAFLAAMREHKVLLLRADWTRSDPAITASLNALGRNGVPVYVLHNPKAPGQPQVLTEVLTLNAVQEALSTLK